MKYKGYTIEYGTVITGYYTVRYCGDEVVFKSMDEAKEFIDEVTA